MNEMNERRTLAKIFEDIRRSTFIEGIGRKLRVKDLVDEIRKNGEEIEKECHFKFNSRKSCAGKVELPKNPTQENYQAAQIMIVTTVAKRIPAKFHRFVELGFIPPSEESGGFLGWIYRPQQ